MAEFEENQFDEMETNPLVDEYVPQESRYFKDSVVVDYENKKMFDIPQAIKVEPDTENDEIYIVPQSSQGRLDKVAYQYYQNSKYWWVLALNNSIDNPFSFTIDKSIRIPSLNNLLLEGVI